MKRTSPAKVNLHLKVLGRRSDGYHNLATFMQQLDLGDELSFQRRTGGITLRCPGGAVPADARNLVYQAALTLEARTGCSLGVDITLIKRIPVAAGLGGGSSNAATTLLALNELFSLGLTLPELINVGATLGADVPFFLFGTQAWAFDIGDRLQHPPTPVPPFWFVLLHPPIFVSTKTVYGRLNLGLTSRAINYSIPPLCTVADVVQGLHNDLETVTLNLHPQLQDLKGILLRHGALGSMMSGSGPTVFGIFAERRDAVRAADALRGAGPWTVYMARSL